MNSHNKLLSDYTDEELVSAGVAGDEAAFARLVQRYTPLIRAQSYTYRVTEAEREDLEQEGLLALFSAVRAFDATKQVKFRTFALICCRNRMCSSLRRSVQEHEIPDGEEVLATLVDDGMADPVRWLLRREESACLRDWLQSALSEREYSVLILYLNAYSYEEIAASLSMTEKSVDNALQRARRKIGRGLLH